MRVSWAFEALRTTGFRGDRTPERRKVGGSTPPLTTQTHFDLGKRRLRERPLAPLICWTTGKYECGGAAFPAARAACRGGVAAGHRLALVDLAVGPSHRPVVPMSVRVCGHVWGG